MIVMADDQSDPPLSRLLQHAGHELRNPLGAVTGYLRMLAKEQAGPLSERQRTLVNEALKSSGRLHDVLNEISHLARIERGEEPLKPAAIELDAVIEAAIEALPEEPDRTIEVELERENPVGLTGDRDRLTLAFTAVLFAVRRELATADRLIVKLVRDGREAVIAIAAPDQVDELAASPLASLSPFTEYRGGCGLKLSIARRIIEQHEGQIYGKGDDQRAMAVIRLPLT